MASAGATQVARGSWGKGDTDCSAESSPPMMLAPNTHRVAQGWDECQWVPLASAQVSTLTVYLLPWVLGLKPRGLRG